MNLTVSAFMFPSDILHVGKELISRHVSQYFHMWPSSSSYYGHCNIFLSVLTSPCPCEWSMLYFLLQLDKVTVKLCEISVEFFSNF
jgi:hypothetical protein